jgi:hypothetical protein
MSREAVLAAFDQARDRFLTAFERVPDPALAFLKPGDDHSIGGLLAHLAGGIGHYTNVLDAAVAGGFREMSDRVDPPDSGRAPDASRRGVGASERGSALGRLRAAHDRFAGRVRDLPEADFERTAAVRYGDAVEPFPTSAALIAGWLTDHYDEHVPHVAELLAAYEAAAV